MKLCIDCKHCTGTMREVDAGVQLKCAKKLSPVTGLPDGDCGMMRADIFHPPGTPHPFGCGHDGDWWEARTRPSGAP
jgi:hypothetical protein